MMEQNKRGELPESEASEVYADETAETDDLAEYYDVAEALEYMFEDRSLVEAAEETRRFALTLGAIEDEAMAALRSQIPFVGDGEIPEEFRSIYSEYHSRAIQVTEHLEKSVPPEQWISVQIGIDLLMAAFYGFAGMYDKFEQAYLAIGTYAGLMGLGDIADTFVDSRDRGFENHRDE